jgi:hypothetical protein
VRRGRRRTFTTFTVPVAYFCEKRAANWREIQARLNSKLLRTPETRALSVPDRDVANGAEIPDKYALPFRWRLARPDSVAALIDRERLPATLAAIAARS